MSCFFGGFYKILVFYEVCVWLMISMLQPVKLLEEYFATSTFGSQNFVHIVKKMRLKWVRFIQECVLCMKYKFFAYWEHCSAEFLDSSQHAYLTWQWACSVSRRSESDSFLLYNIKLIIYCNF